MTEFEKLYSIYMGPDKARTVADCDEWNAAREQVCMSIANTTVPATWSVSPTETWFTMEPSGLGVQIKVKRDVGNIGKSISLEAEYNGDTYSKLILIRSLV